MSLVTAVAQTFTVTGTCDQCGTVRQWTQPENPDDSYDELALGFDMRDPRFRSEPKGLWFCQRSCVHDWIDANVIDHLRLAAAS